MTNATFGPDPAAGPRPPRHPSPHGRSPGPAAAPARCHEEPPLGGTASASTPRPPAALALTSCPPGHLLQLGEAGMGMGTGTGLSRISGFPRRPRPSSTYPAPSCTRRSCGCPPASTSRRKPRPWRPGAGAGAGGAKGAPCRPRRPAYKAGARRGAGRRGWRRSAPAGRPGAAARSLPAPPGEGAPPPRHRRGPRGGR